MTMAPAKINYKIYEGSTFKETFRWESQNKAFYNISGITQAAPCIITTATEHSIPVNWRFRVTNVSGMKDINLTGDEQYYVCTGVTSTSLIIGKLNSAGFSAYTSGGVVEYNLPVPLNGMSAVMQIRETVDSETIIHQATSALGGGITINNDDKTIMLIIPAAVTREFNFATAVYSIELTDAAGTVYPFVTGNMTLVREVVR